LISIPMLDDPPAELGELVRLKGGVEGNDPGRTFVDCKGIVFVLVLDVLSVEMFHCGLDECC
jgi:hypothetical protein